LMPDQLENGEWQLRSDVLALILRTDGPDLRLYDPEANAYLRMPEETEAALQAAEAEIERLKALLEQQK